MKFNRNIYMYVYKQQIVTYIPRNISDLMECKHVNNWKTDATKNKHYIFSEAIRSSGSQSDDILRQTVMRGAVLERCCGSGETGR